MAAVATDNFNRSDGLLGSNWTVEDDGLSIAGNAVRQTIYGVEVGARYEAASFSNDQYSEAEAVSNNDSNAAIGVSVRVSADATNYYGVYWSSIASYVFRRTTSDGWQQNIWATGGSGTLEGQSYVPPSGTRVRIEVEGQSTVTVRVYWDDALKWTFTDTSANRVLSGKPGLTGYNNAGTTTIDNWEGGDLGGGRTQPRTLRMRN